MRFNGDFVRTAAIRSKPKSNRVKALLNAPPAAVR
jgi:hypothetical protein